MPAPRDARPDAAADQAAHDVLTALYPTLKTGPDQLLAAELAATPDTRGKQQGIRVGDIVAKRLIGLRSSDGSAATPPPFVAGNQPGDYARVKIYPDSAHGFLFQHHTEFAADVQAFLGDPS